MPNFAVLNNIGRQTARAQGMEARLKEGMETKRVHNATFLRKKFDGYSIYGYMISNVSRIGYADKPGWDVVEYLLHTYSKPQQQYANYDVFLAKNLPLEAKRSLINLTGDSSYVGDNALFLCRRSL